MSLTFQKIKKKINWVTWRMYFILALDVLILIAYFPFVYYVTQEPGASWVANSWHYAMGIFVIYGVYLDFKIRLPILRNNADSTKEVLELYLNRTKAGVKIGWWGKVFCWAMLAVFWVWVLANSFSELGDPDIAEIEFKIFGSIWIGMFLAIFYWYQRKKQKELDELSSLWREYLD